MKRFKFKLETVLKERKRVEDTRLRELVLAQNILQGMVNQRTALEKRLAEAIDEMTVVTGTDVGLAGVMESFISGQKTRIHWKTMEIERGTKLVEKKRLDYVQARQKREALEKLKERQHAEYLEAARKRELKQLDDIYIMNGAFKARMQEEEASS